MKRQKHYFLYTLLLLITLLVSGCNPTSQETKTLQKDFDNYINSIFIEEVQSDSITLNYTLSQPEAYGITKVTPSFGTCSVSAIKESLATSENYLAGLTNFPYEDLTAEQQLTYDILENYLEPDKDSSDFILYSQILSPTLGIQAQLPVLLAEYNFYNKEDIDTYLNLLPSIYTYFKEIVAFEQEKSNAGLFMSDYTVDGIIKQCNSFVANKEDNLLIEVFQDKLSSFPDLSKQEKDDYCQTNKEIVLNHVIPAYNYLIQGLTELKGTGVNENGLCGFDKGKQYYEYLVETSTGSSKSIKEINSLLDSSLENSLTSISNIINKDPNTLDKAVSITYPHTEPKETMEYLKNCISKDFPSVEDVNYTIKYVHESLEENLSPAFFLIPAIDRFDKNCIYINGSDNYDLSALFTTLAHEGYPGHLYQTVYYNQQNPPPIRSLLNFSGYCEGWATYVELYSYHLAEIDNTVASLLKNNLIATLIMYSKLDIGIHYYGWTLSDTSEFLKNYGITQQAEIEQIYHAIIEDPANYLKYTLGYLEIMELRNKAESQLGEKFNLKRFHTFLLEIGPAQFQIIDKNLDQWIKTNK